MKVVRCIFNQGCYWHYPFPLLSRLLTLGQDYEVRDTEFYRVGNKWVKKYLVPTPEGCKNMPAKFFKTVKADKARKHRALRRWV